MRDKKDAVTCGYVVWRVCIILMSRTNFYDYLKRKHIAFDRECWKIYEVLAHILIVQITLNSCSHCYKNLTKFLKFIVPSNNYIVGICRMWAQSTLKVFPRFFFFHFLIIDLCLDERRMLYSLIDSYFLYNLMIEITEVFNTWTINSSTTEQMVFHILLLMKSCQQVLIESIHYNLSRFNVTWSTLILKSYPLVHSLTVLPSLLIIFCL